VFPTLLLATWALSGVGLGVDVDVAGAGADVRLPSLEAAVLAEINTLRGHPHAYADHVRRLVDAFDDRGRLCVPGARPIPTVEGRDAVVEAARALAGIAAPAPPLSPSSSLAAAAAEHVRDQGATGDVGHRGSDGSNSRARITRHGTCDGVAGEVIDYGWRDARALVVDLVVDDGVKDRGHRVNLLDPVYRTAGVACGPHRVYGVMCVVELAERWEPRVGAPSTSLASP
jgi:hypothetical protein